MNRLCFSRYAFICVAAAMLAGCGGSQPPIGAPGAMRERAAETQAAHDPFQMHRPATSGDLVYITADNYKKAFYIFTYPAGEWVVKVKTSYYPAGVCSDETGNVFITGASNIYEYAHGATKPTRTLADPGNAEVWS
jgi:hypothetical protein